jgi:DNA invertase Pin-like site-specific DNA recombinase
MKSQNRTNTRIETPSATTVLRLSQNVVSKRIGYVRVSKVSQSLDQHIDALSVAGCSEIHRDNGVSGSVRIRAGLDGALAALRDGDVLVVVALDRLGRDLGDLVRIVERLRERGCHLVSLRESIDTTTAVGQMLFGIFGSLGQYERALIMERTSERLAAKKRRGERVGRKPALTPSQVVAAQTLLESGTSAVTVARNLGCSRATLYRHLAVTKDVA